MLPIHFDLAAPEATRRLGLFLAKYSAQLPSVWLLNGELGSGKTTFVQGLAAGLGIDEPLTSPTFALVHEYKTSADKLLFHFDLYRLSSADEVFELGFEDYLMKPNSLCLFEWAEKFPDIFSDTALKIHFFHADPGRRVDIYLPLSCVMLETIFRKDWQS
jgi:tRNA threonylcarbamoyladenosine biosynthesis protein TsaE